jgi:predicted DNA-binding WGR domain protein
MCIVTQWYGKLVNRTKNQHKHYFAAIIQRDLTSYDGYEVVFAHGRIGARPTNVKQGPKVPLAVAQQRFTRTVNSKLKKGYKPAIPYATHPRPAWFSEIQWREQLRNDNKAAPVKAEPFEQPVKPATEKASKSKGLARRKDAEWAW